jgi:hypothetical protein
LAVTVTLAGVLPDGGLTDSQVPPELVVAATVNDIAAPVLFTESGCGPGRLPPSR